MSRFNSLPNVQFATVLDPGQSRGIDYLYKIKEANEIRKAKAQQVEQEQMKTGMEQLNKLYDSGNLWAKYKEQYNGVVNEKVQGLARILTDKNNPNRFQDFGLALNKTVGELTALKGRITTLEDADKTLSEQSKGLKNFNYGSALGQFQQEQFLKDGKLVDPYSVDPAKFNPNSFFTEAYLPHVDMTGEIQDMLKGMSKSVMEKEADIKEKRIGGARAYESTTTKAETTPFSEFDPQTGKIKVNLNSDRSGWVFEEAKRKPFVNVYMEANGRKLFEQDVAANPNRSNVNGSVVTSWDQLPESAKDVYKKQALEGALQPFSGSVSSKTNTTTPTQVRVNVGGSGNTNPKQGQGSFDPSNIYQVIDQIDNGAFYTAYPELQIPDQHPELGGTSWRDVTPALKGFRFFPKDEDGREVEIDRIFYNPQRGTYLMKIGDTYDELDRNAIIRMGAINTGGDGSVKKAAEEKVKYSKPTQSKLQGF